VETTTSEGQDIVDSILANAWTEVTRILTPTANGYVLPLDQVSFKIPSHVWVCPYTRRFLDATLCAISPYSPRRIAVAEKCKPVEIPVYDLPFGGATEGHDPVVQGRAWLEAQPLLVDLREEGLWSTFNE
jgi:hypothetical protein